MGYARDLVRPCFIALISFLKGSLWCIYLVLIGLPAMVMDNRITILPQCHWSHARWYDVAISRSSITRWYTQNNSYIGKTCQEDFAFTNDTPYIAVMSELWCVFCEKTNRDIARARSTCEIDRHQNTTKNRTCKYILGRTLNQRNTCITNLDYRG